LYLCYVSGSGIESAGADKRGYTGAKSLLSCVINGENHAVSVHKQRCVRKNAEKVRHYFEEIG